MKCFGMCFAKIPRHTRQNALRNSGSPLDIIRVKTRSMVRFIFTMDLFMSCCVSLCIVLLPLCIDSNVKFVFRC